VIQVYVEGCWLYLPDNIKTIPEALVQYAEINHPKLGYINIVPRNYPLRER
jgi:hypothetical protein